MALPLTETPTGERARRRADQTQVSAVRSEEITTEEIERRAYELFVERGGTHGSDVEDWLAAENELVRARLSES